MKGILRKRLPGLRKGESGFTLVELLVVVGIIVALAAVIIPNVARFAGKGETGAQAAEGENVQTAMDTMMADKGITSMDAQDLSTSSTAVNDFTSEPTGTSTSPLIGYLRNNPTKYYYCWDGTGVVTEQFTTGASCTQ